MNELENNTKELLRLLFGAPAPKPQLPLGRCACHEPTVRWCTRHGEPLKAASNSSALNPG